MSGGFQAVARDVEYAANHLRTANHSMMRGLLDGPGSAVVVGGLEELAGRLTPLLEFLVRSVESAEPGEHYDDQGGDVAATLAAARGHLDNARVLALGVADGLRAAHNQLGRVGRRHDPDEDLDETGPDAEVGGGA